MKIRTKMYLLFFLIGLMGTNAQAQEEPSSFSLSEAQQYAMKNSYVLHNTRQDITIARKKVWETITIGLPQVSGSANYNMFLNLPVSLIPGEFFGGDPGTYIPVKFGQDFNSDFGLTVSQQIFDGSYIVGVGSSKLYLNLSQQAHEKAEIDIRDAVSQAYYLVLVSERVKLVMEENLENTKWLYDETKAYFENGFREEQDVQQVRLMLKNAENEVVKAQREISIAKVVLKYTMGYDLEKEIVLTGKLDSYVMPLVARQSSFDLDLNSHIDFRLAQSSYSVAEKMLNLEKAAYLPKLNGFYSYTKTSYGNNANLFGSDSYWYPSSLVGLQMTMPLFSSGQKRSKVQQARIELDKAATQQKLTEITLQKDFLTASADLESAIDRYINDSENRELAQTILEKTKIKFNNGITSSAELTQIETQYINTFQALIGSTLQLLQADLKLKKAAGNL